MRFFNTNKRQDINFVIKDGHAFFNKHGRQITPEEFINEHDEAIQELKATLEEEKKRFETVISEIGSRIKDPSEYLKQIDIKDRTIDQLSKELKILDEKLAKLKKDAQMQSNGAISELRAENVKLSQEIANLNATIKRIKDRTDIFHRIANNFEREALITASISKVIGSSWHIYNTPERMIRRFRERLSSIVNAEDERSQLLEFAKFIGGASHGKTMDEKYYEDWIKRIAEEELLPREDFFEYHPDIILNSDMVNKTIQLMDDKLKLNEFAAWFMPLETGVFLIENFPEHVKTYTTDGQFVFDTFFNLPVVFINQTLLSQYFSMIIANERYFFGITKKGEIKEIPVTHETTLALTRMSEYRPTSTVELPYVAPNSVENYTLEQLMRLANAKIISYDEIATLLNGKFDKSILK